MTSFTPVSSVFGTSPADPDATWDPGSWQSFPAAQQPDWPEPERLAQTVDQLALLPPLVSGVESARLREALGAAAAGQGFLLQAGDCAESLRSFHAESVHHKVKVILQMATILAFGSGLPVIKVGRIAGQMAKPRSNPVEPVDGPDGPLVVPSYRGDMVNGSAPTPEARRPDPDRLLRAYYQSAASLNLLRTFTEHGFATLDEVHAWNRQYVGRTSERPSSDQRYVSLIDDMEHVVRYLGSHPGARTSELPDRGFDFFTSHEALILPYEQALTRWDPATGHWQDTSAHMVWIGERTRQLDGAHVEFAAGIDNPIGVKVGPGMTPEELLALCTRLDPTGLPGRLTLITRMGAGRIREALPPLVRAVREAGHPVLWVCDPMHGNTFTGESGLKTRRFADILDELRGFFEVHRSEGTHPGGVHLELTGEDVTECLGGSPEILDAHLATRYETACDPRLNRTQALELAFLTAEMLQR
ncbi:3-deoxy-7-phosphoheptulonate synthase class II [Kitasatospora sp. GP82]|uniref:class II 3-deoxy-7-phosphoheptulonate synthase n=1 Tax=Kitasatospora sp. GP82 TaxID=3035089 RepID=UPI00247354E8|nr:3-deoxy-7-phosphoheptulonate synthase class II [Kitasatospora sp. GP82]MDH6124063.1 3-deoxy-7-phosphoheptulonate synthase [Kitasatospora sp. GP82]